MNKIDDSGKLSLYIFLSFFLSLPHIDIYLNMSGAFFIVLLRLQRCIY